MQDADKVNSFKHRMNTLAYGEAMMAAARDYGQVRCLGSAHSELCAFDLC